MIIYLYNLTQQLQLEAMLIIHVVGTFYGASEDAGARAGIYD
jgi:hypothetical protein